MGDKKPAPAPAPKGPYERHEPGRKESGRSTTGKK